MRSATVLLLVACSLGLTLASQFPPAEPATTDDTAVIDSEKRLDILDSEGKDEEKADAGDEMGENMEDPAAVDKLALEDRYVDPLMNSVTPSGVLEIMKRNKGKRMPEPKKGKNYKFGTAKVLTAEGDIDNEEGDDRAGAWKGDDTPCDELTVGDITEESVSGLGSDMVAESQRSGAAIGLNAPFDSYEPESLAKVEEDLTAGSTPAVEDMALLSIEAVTTSGSATQKALTPQSHHALNDVSW